MPDSPFDFRGRRALVTGGRSGIGRACVQGLLAGGARVASLDVSAAPVSNPEGPHELVADVRDPVQVAAAVAEAAQEMGGLDTVVQCAGVARDGVLWKLEQPAWDETIGVNLTGAWMVLRACVGPMRKAGGGTVVHVSSINGLRGKFGQAAYASSKAGLIGLTKTAARELGAFGVRVNAVAPGFVHTPMTDHLPKEIVEIAESESLLGRLSDAEDVAHAVLFLSSDLARQITGVVLKVDAGQYV